MANIFEKIIASHQINDDLIYIDLHLVHEVTSPQAFEGLKIAGRTVRRPDKTLATVDHNVSTNHPITIEDIKNALSRKQVQVLEDNCKEHDIPIHSIGSDQRGIVHMIGPELGLTQPGTTIVCGDSHTSTHGAFGALAFGIGTSEVEHVLATQTLLFKKPLTMKINFTGELHEMATAKDLILFTIGKLGASGMTGYLVEYAGPAITALSMEERLTVCNMSIEGGAKAGIISPDHKTIDYLKDKITFNQEQVEKWLEFASDENADYDRTIEIDVSQVKPMVTWGTTPAMVVAADQDVPEPENSGHQRALEYMQLVPGTKLTEIDVEEVFIGSCTNSRISDLREVAKVIKSYPETKVKVKSRIVPGSETVRRQAEAEGLDEIFISAGFEWASSGCSSCLGMADALGKVRVASTSNRNFEGRQGKGTMTHLMSPRMAAQAALTGKLAS
jgi:3-isopropylmalate/(R)-2-methylmalate dehydratase large subunit